MSWADKTDWLIDRQSQCDFEFDFSWCSTNVEAGSNTSNVTLRVVGGEEKGNLKSETVKHGLKSLGQGPAAYTKDRPVLSSERAPHKNMTVTVKQ
jgi:hypothetical protein